MPMMIFRFYSEYRSEITVTLRTIHSSSKKMTTNKWLESSPPTNSLASNKRTPPPSSTRLPSHAIHHVHQAVSEFDRSAEEHEPQSQHGAQEYAIER